MTTSDNAEFEHLLAAVAGRDRAAFRQLYDRAGPKLFATVLRIIRNKPAAEEILQDVFLRIWQNAESFSPQTAPARVWMNSIARNRAIDVLRQKGFTPVSAADDDGKWYERIAEDRDREGDMIDNATLRHCLGTIEPQARDCVLFAYYEGYSREELAKHYDRPVNTIKTWLHRALVSLRSCMEGPRS